MKRIIEILFLCMMVLSSLAIKAQEGGCSEIDNKKAIKLYQKGVEKLQEARKSRGGDVESLIKDAIADIKEAIEEEPEFPDAYFALGEYYYKKQNATVAEKYLDKAYSICPEFPNVYLYFYLADVAYGKEEWAKAEKLLALFMKDVDKVRSDADYNKAEFLYKRAKFYNKLYANPVEFNPESVEGISTPKDEYLPIITPDEEFAFFTRRYEKQKIASNSWDAGDEYIERFSMSERKDGKYQEGNALPPPFNLTLNEGGATLTIDNQYLYYTVCATTSSRYYNCDICFTENKDGYWEDVKNMGAVVNDPTSWDAQPSISSDGKVLYFTSDRPGGLGGYDIWFTTKDDNGNWSKPQNMGTPINTSGNERSPYIHTDSETLYFTSSDRYDEKNDKWFDGHLGLGGYDIFFVKKGKDGKWEKPKNIGYPINSKDDEAGFFVSTNGKTGYFASDKQTLGGKGGWDLYSFNLYEGARPEKVLFIKGNINEGNSEMPTEAEIKLVNVKTKEIRHIPINTQTGKYVAALKFDNDYVMEVKKDGYAYNAKYISQADTAFEKPNEIDFDMQKVEVGSSYTLNDIFFATNSAELTLSSKVIIDGFVEFLITNPNLSVSINGHTDNVGDQQANLTLSSDRAKSVFEYMITKGIEADRLKYKGYGETKPVASNNTEEGRAKNRRTEFEIVQK